MLASDGLEDPSLENLEVSVDGPLPILATHILKSGAGKGEDDATVALIRLRPAGLPAS